MLLLSLLPRTAWDRDRDGKTYKRASNAHVIFFLAQVKSMPNFTFFCRKSERCRNLLFSFVVIFWHFMTIYGALWDFLKILGHFMPLFLACYTVLWRIHLYCNLLTFLGKIILAQTLLVYIFLSFSMSEYRGHRCI